MGEPFGSAEGSFAIINLKWALWRQEKERRVGGSSLRSVR